MRGFDAREMLSPDGPLGILVHGVNSSTERRSDGPGVVLTVGGLVVSGRLIPNWQWFEELAEANEQAGKASGVAKDENLWALLFEKLGSEIASGRDESKAVEKVFDKLPDRYARALNDEMITAFIHLSEARVYNGGAALPGNGMLWRGRLSEVTGWSWGLLGPDQSD